MNNIAFIDAPLLGGPDDTVAGSAPCIIVGDKEFIDRVMDLIGCYASPIDYVGKSGDAHLIKLAMNFRGLSYAVITAQMFSLMEKMGIDAKKLFSIMNTKIFGNWILIFMAKNL